MSRGGTKRDRERERERERGRISSRLQAVNAELDPVLDLMNHEIMT